MASSSIFPFVFKVGFAFLSDAKAKDEELFGPSERRGRFAIVLGGGGVVFDFTQQGGSFLHKKPTMMMMMMMMIHTKDKVFETT
jgi:hypothetical protein